MLPTDAPVEPLDPTTLARQAVDDSLTADDRARALAALVPIVRRLARSVAACRGQTRADLIDESVSHVLLPERLRQFNPAVGVFEGWCRVVLRNRLVELVRARQRRQERVESHLSDTLAGRDSSLACLAAQMDLTAPFHPADLGQVAGWGPLDRVVLLCLGGLWQKVPPPRWAEWLDDCGLDPPFPDPDFASCANADERIAHLSASLGCTSVALDRRWYRGRERLGRLSFIRQLREEG